MTILIRLGARDVWVAADQVLDIKAGTHGPVVRMKDGTVYEVPVQLVREIGVECEKLVGQVNEAISILAAPHLRINPDGYATALTARWHYPAAGELAPPGAIVQLLTVGGLQVQGIWRDSGSYIAWSPNLKRDRALEKQHGIKTP